MNWLKDKWQRFKKWIVGLVIIPVALASGGVVVDNQIDPYTDEGDFLKTSFVQTLPESGEVTVELMKDKPKVIFTKWNDEVRLGVKYKGLPTNTTGKRALLTNRMEWKGVKEEVHAYPIEAKEGMEDGGFEIEIVLNEKPTTNVFEFQLEGWEDLDFFYQPALTQEDIDSGISMPENVIGSYAVYHKTKANYCTNCDDDGIKIEREIIRADGTSTTTRITATNYAAGKIGMFYRPKMTDADGNWTWEELHIENGLLTITPPQTFLDNAVYPVSSKGTTFGYTSIGSALTLQIAWSPADRSATIGTASNLSEAGTLDKISVVVYNANVTLDVFAVIYREDSAGSDSHDIVVGIERLDLSITTTKTWYDFIGSSEELSADDYILAAIGNGEDFPSGTVYVPADTGASGQRYYAENTNFGGSYAIRKGEDPWGIVDVSNDYFPSIYVTYTASGGEPAEPSIVESFWDDM